MAVTEVTAQLVKNESSSSQTVIWPKTKSNAVTLSNKSSYYSSASDLDTLVKGLGSLAFKSYDIVTSLSSAASGTLVDGSAIKTLYNNYTTLQSTVDELSSKRKLTYLDMTIDTTYLDTSTGLNNGAQIDYGYDLFGISYQFYINPSKLPSTNSYFTVATCSNPPAVTNSARISARIFSDSSNVGMLLARVDVIDETLQVRLNGYCAGSLNSTVYVELWGMWRCIY